MISSAHQSFFRHKALQPIVGGALLALAALAGGCAPSTATMEQRLPTVVSVSQPVQQQVVDYAVFIGHTKAVDEVEVRARVSGYLNKVAFQAGAEVKANDLLFEIDPRPYQADFDQATAQLAKDQASLERASADLARSKQLLASRATSAQDYDTAVANQKLAAASVLESQAKVERAQLNMQFTKITAPIAGRVSRNLITEGNLVAADNTLLTTIVSVAPMYVYFDVDEGTLLSLQREAHKGNAATAKISDVPAELSLTGQNDFPCRGQLDSTDNRVDPNTGTLEVRAVFANQDRALSPGLSVRVRLPVTDPYQALMVTERAIGSDQGQKYLLVVDPKNVVEQRNVTLGTLHDGLRVIRAGLRPGERVIVNGLQRVRPGLTVDPKPVTMPGLPDAGPINADSGSVTK